MTQPHPPNHKRILFTVLFLLAAALPLLWSPASYDLAAGLLAPASLEPAVAPVTATAYTATRQITALACEADGTLWAGTSGGVLRRSPAGAWRKWSRIGDTVVTEVRAIAVSEAGVAVHLPQRSLLWRNEQWQPLATAISITDVSTGKKPVTANAYQGVSTQWTGYQVVATLQGLAFEKNGVPQVVPLPLSPGSHISALLPRGPELWAAMYGDGLWSWNGSAWRPVEINLPAAARQVTALAAHGALLFVGTRRDGVWECDGGLWSQHQEGEEPFDHNVQNLAVYRGVLLGGTLEDGVVARSGAAWRHFGGDKLSSNAPRQMVEFSGKLWVRHGTGKIDVFDGAAWQLNVAPQLPRGKALALAADKERLYVGQWGGWSEFDGTTWQHYFKLPDLAGVAIIGMYANAGHLWIHTQSQGIVEVERSPGGAMNLTWHDERHGLPDDWITAMSQVGPRLYAGTFIGGLAWLDGASGRDGCKWQTAPELKGENVTALEPDNAGGLFVATRHGVWRRDAAGTMTRLNLRWPWLTTEVQSLALTPDGLWIAGRTALDFIPLSELNVRRENIAVRGASAPAAGIWTAALLAAPNCSTHHSHESQHNT